MTDDMPRKILAIGQAIDDLQYGFRASAVELSEAMKLMMESQREMMKRGRPKE